MPTLTIEFFLETAKEFGRLWDFINYTGSINGKYTCIKFRYNSTNIMIT